MWSARAWRSSTSPPVIATAARNVAASTRSGIVSCFVGRSDSTPSTSIVDVPAPSICAPIALRRSAKSEISGSRAAFSITVAPFANAAAMRMFSVAPTLGNSSVTGAPLKPSAQPRTYPCSSSNVAPSASSPDRCMSIGREPKSSPPGSATRASPHRASNGPSTPIDARMRSTR